MKSSKFVIAALLAALCVGSAQADESNAWTAIREKAVSVVSIKFVLNIQCSMGGRSLDHEVNREVRGVIIDETGLILTANSHFDAIRMIGIPRRFRSQVDIKSTPSDIRVLFGNEEDEFEAALVARDTNLDLAFLQILDLKDRKVKIQDNCRTENKNHYSKYN